MERHIKPMQILKLARLAKQADIPNYQTEKSSGLDLAAIEMVIIAPGHWQSVRTGLSVAIPGGHEGQIRPRSGLAAKHGVTVLNAPGTIDEDYRGEVKVLLINHGRDPYTIKPGDRIAQIVICPVVRVRVEAVDTLDPTGRGAGGFGSTGL